MIFYKKFKNSMIKLLEGSLALAMLLLVLAVLWQIFARKLEIKSPWSDELARFLLIWSSLLGAALGFQRMQHLGINLMVNLCDNISKHVAYLFSFILVSGFTSYVMLYSGARLVKEIQIGGSISPALGMPMWYWFLSILVSGAFILFFMIDNGISYIQKSRTENCKAEVK